jgi:hypothetical protein
MVKKTMFSFEKMRYLSPLVVEASFHYQCIYNRTPKKQTNNQAHPKWVRVGVVEGQDDQYHSFE